MDCFIRSHSVIDGIQIHAVGGEIAAGNRLIDACDGLVNDAACAEAHMTDLGVTHLAFGEANIEPGS